MIPRPEVESRFTHVSRLSALLGVGIFVVLLSVCASILQLRDLHDRSVLNRKANRAAQRVTVDAVNCIRYSLSEHRWVNEEYHREQAVSLKLPLPSHSPLPPRPTTEQITAACVRFDEAVSASTSTTEVKK